MEQETCMNCKGPISGRGSKNSLLKGRYCRRVPCQTARQRAYRATLRGQEADLMETRPCFCCNAELPARSKRVTDSEVGRWCPKFECQRDRGRRMAAYTEIVNDQARGENPTWELTIELSRLFFEMRDRDRTECPDCGRRDAIRGYRHPRWLGDGNCTGTGNFPVPGREIQLAFED